MTRVTRLELRSELDFKSIPEDAELSEVIDNYNKYINHFNFFSKAFSLQSNFNGFITELTIAASQTVTVEHFLGVIPKWRIILRQTGNGVISDIPEEWNERTVAFYNNGPSTVTFTVFIVRE